jgi:hypothetical protein
MHVINAFESDKTVQNIHLSAKDVPKLGVHALTALGSSWVDPKRVSRAASSIKMTKNIPFISNEDLSTRQIRLIP